MENININTKKLAQECSNFDFIRFVLCDLYGIAKSKSIPSRNVAFVLEGGVSIWSGIIACGPKCELPLGITCKNKDVESCGNLTAAPICDSVSPVPWACEGSHKVGQVLCEPRWPDGLYQDTSPRYVARRQLSELKAMGYNLYSSYEVECYISEKTSGQPLGQQKQMLNLLQFAANEKLIYDMERYLHQHGVDLQALECELSQGQFEFTIRPQLNILSSDMVFKLKQALKEISISRGLHTTFMTTPYVDSSNNGLHFNFSIWNAEKKNIFYDPEKEDNISDIALYFIGGILFHSKALTALCCPTPNCYRRINHPGVVPCRIDWGLDNRFAMLRVKNQSASGTYIENRLPSGACNPYLAQAATLAAGLDGIKKKTSPPAKCPKGMQRSQEATSLPGSLKEAITELEKDEVLIDALGEEFVRWFVYTRNNYDLSLFGHHNVMENCKEEIAAERQEYSLMM